MSAQPTRDDEQQPLDAVESPGKRLRIARQAKGMSQGDIATHLHLSQSIVQALENDDYDRLPGPVFARGYLRNYARLLGLADDSILAGYDGAHTDHSHRPAPVHQGVRPEIRSSYFAVRLVSGILVIGLLGLLAAWWQGHLEWSNGILDQALEAESFTPDTEDGGNDGLTLPRSEPDPTPGQLPRIGESTMESAPAAADEAPEEPVPAAEEATEGPAPEPAAGTFLVAEEEPQTAADEAAAEAPPEKPGTGGGAAASEIVFEFLGPCWVDIRDSTRKFKLFGEMRKGKSKVLGGTPPYSVILGNSAMVRVTVDGRPFDIEALSHGSVARFTLDPGAAE
jgi:cytoskeleton protein RodZ